MNLTPRVRKILSYYESDNAGTKARLAQILMHGRLGGTGKLVVLAVDQGFEHGPTRGFAANPEAYDPHYHCQLAIDAGLSAYAAPLGMIESIADTFVGSMPLILKLNSGNTIAESCPYPDQAVTASVRDALRLGCSAVGFTIYPGSDYTNEMIEEFREVSLEAKSHGLAVIIWSYPRGHMSKEGETAIDVASYSTHIGALLGAHIIKAKIPTNHIESSMVESHFKSIPISTLADRIRYMVQCAFRGRRIITFSGGTTKESDGLLDEIRAICEGGGHGSMIGRNCFQRPREESLKILDEIIKIYSDAK